MEERYLLIAEIDFLQSVNNLFFIYSKLSFVETRNLYNF
jgi:hypothetical protein